MGGCLSRPQEPLGVPRKHAQPVGAPAAPRTSPNGKTPLGKQPHHPHGPAPGRAKGRASLSASTSEDSELQHAPHSDERHSARAKHALSSAAEGGIALFGDDGCAQAEAVALQVAGCCAAPAEPAAITAGCCGMPLLHSTVACMPAPAPPKPDGLEQLTLDAFLAGKDGLVHDVVRFGAPRPANEEARMATVRALGCMQMGACEELDRILKVMCHIWAAPAACVTLLDSDSVYLCSGLGMQVVRAPWGIAMCPWMLLPPQPGCMAIQDLRADARFARSVHASGGTRAYLTSPLVASNGHRLGAICFTDTKPRRFTAGDCRLMNNWAELAVRAIEAHLHVSARLSAAAAATTTSGGAFATSGAHASAHTHTHTKSAAASAAAAAAAASGACAVTSGAHASESGGSDDGALMEEYRNRVRDVDGAEEAVVLLVDTAAPGWSVLYVSPTWEALTGRPRGEVEGRALNDVLCHASGDPRVVWEGVEREAAAGRAFVTPRVCCRGAASASQDASFYLSFRPAALADADELSVPLGVPASVPQTASPATAKLFFARLHTSPDPPANSRAQSRDPAGSASILTTGRRLPPNVAINPVHGLTELYQGLVVGQVLGQGSYGTVYHGRWHGVDVAIKVVDLHIKGQEEQMRAEFEVRLGQRLHHVHVVHTLAHASALLERASSPDDTEDDVPSTGGWGGGMQLEMQPSGVGGASVGGANNSSAATPRRVASSLAGDASASRAGGGGGGGGAGGVMFIPFFNYAGLAMEIDAMLPKLEGAAPIVPPDGGGGGGGGGSIGGGGSTGGGGGGAVRYSRKGTTPLQLAIVSGLEGGGSLGGGGSVSGGGGRAAYSRRGTAPQQLASASALEGGGRGGGGGNNNCPSALVCAGGGGNVVPVVAGEGVLVHVALPSGAQVPVLRHASSALPAPASSTTDDEPVGPLPTSALRNPGGGGRGQQPPPPAPSAAAAAWRVGLAGGPLEAMSEELAGAVTEEGVAATLSAAALALGAASLVPSGPAGAGVGAGVGAALRASPRGTVQGGPPGVLAGAHGGEGHRSFDDDASSKANATVPAGKAAEAQAEDDGDAGDEGDDDVGPSPFVSCPVGVAAAAAASSSPAHIAATTAIASTSAAACARGFSEPVRDTAAGRGRGGGAGAAESAPPPLPTAGCGLGPDVSTSQHPGAGGGDTGPQQHHPLWMRVGTGLPPSRSASDVYPPAEGGAVVAGGGGAPAGGGGAGGEGRAAAAAAAGEGAMGTVAGPIDVDLSGLTYPLDVRLWMVLEFADKGSLQDAIDRGWLRAGHVTVDDAPDYPAVLATLIEVAAALSYIHSQDVVHGDLSAVNILLQSVARGQDGAASPHDATGRGFVAKVSDFGLSMQLTWPEQAIRTASYGTITHQAPEVLRESALSKAGDVYSVGVLLWQMVTGSRPWPGLSHLQVSVEVGQRSRTLAWPEWVHGGVRALGRRCMSPLASERPTAAEVVAEAQALMLTVPQYGLL